MMRITIEVCPFGDEDNSRVIHTVDVGQVAAYDNDPDGWREYAFWRYQGDAVQDKGTVDPDGYLTHKRSHGALYLAAEVLAELEAERF